MKRGVQAVVTVATIARAVFELRTALGWTQAELARRAGVSQALVSAVESARIAGLSFETATRLLEAMGATLTIVVDTPRVVEPRHQVDAAHARCLEHVIRRLGAAGWRTEREVEIGDRVRGWIDVLAFQPSTGQVLVVEVKTELRDLGGLERSVGWYEREAWSAARRLGWRPKRVAAVVLLLATRVNDERVRANRESLAAAFPARATELTRAVASGDFARRRTGLAMIDPRSRRRQWLRPTRSDGRRSAAPYEDYADFMRAQTAGRRAAA